jgi:hypothetical protein
MLFSKNMTAVLSHLAVLGFALLLLSAAEGDNLKLWDPGDKLTWSDFQDKPPASGGIRAALTNSTIRLDFNQVSERTFTFNVVSAMDRSRSWVYPDRKTDYILAHEQYHFNITEYGARKMRKDLTQAKYTIKNIKSKVMAIQKQDIAALTAMQDEYDKDTRHSINKEQQQQWQEKVDKLLLSLQDYTNPNVTVMVKN